VRAEPLSTTVFAIAGSLLLLAAVALAALGSFAFVAAASVGMFFIAAALIARSVRTGDRATALMALTGIALVVFGLVATPFFYAGWVLVAGAAALAVAGRLARPRA
jgi:hypothetical protein